MKPLAYNSRQKRRASSLMALGTSERDAAENLIEAGLYREAVVHLYFTCFYVSQAMLCHLISSNPTHKHVESQLHRAYGRSPEFPRRYVTLHSNLHSQRDEFDYRTTHTPDPDVLKEQLRILTAFVNFASHAVPRVQVLDLLRGIAEDNPANIKDFSFDIYCPKTYAHHTRLTFWQPPFYLDVFNVSQMVRGAVSLLHGLRVRRSQDYVVGLNSRVNQYKDDHLILLDIDAVNPAVEAALKPVGGILLKSGRGFHFIGREVISGRRDWRRKLKAVLRDGKLKMHVDKAHIEISLSRGYSTLRVTSSPVKPTVPYFYKEI
ncbi:MAG: HEPN domain-containing protein [Planctomycetes bacterium]|nr:HEPN domain-containing protein [Planctomycetota bacterium]